MTREEAQMLIEAVNTLEWPDHVFGGDRYTGSIAESAVAHFIAAGDEVDAEGATTAQVIEYLLDKVLREADQ